MMPQASTARTRTPETDASSRADERRGPRCSPQRGPRLLHALPPLHFIVHLAAFILFFYRPAICTRTKARRLWPEIYGHGVNTEPDSTTPNPPVGEITHR